MAYQFLGTSTRVYPQYRDTSTWVTLIAEPGGSYDMAPAMGAGNVDVPPSDGLWAAPAPKNQRRKTAASAAEGE